MYKSKSNNFHEELKKLNNSILAYKNCVDCRDKTLIDIEDESFHLLNNCFEEVYFIENKDVASVLKNSVRLFGAVTSLGGAFVCELQHKHYSDIYEVLYKPLLYELKILKDKNNKVLLNVAGVIKRYNDLMVKSESILKKR